MMMKRDVFDFAPSAWLPVQDKKVLDYCRNIKREEMETLPHPCPDYKVQVVPHPSCAMAAELFRYIWRSDVEDKKTVIIFPNSWRDVYTAAVGSCNRFNVSGRNIHAFCMDEWADIDGNVAPITYTPSLGAGFLRYFYMSFRPDLRPPLEQMHYYTNENIKHYTEMIEEEGNGGADLVISATGWIGHTAFVDPYCKAFQADSLEEFLTLGARFVDNRRLTIIQNSTGAIGGMAGDLAYTPCCSVSIGPRDVHHARHHIERHDIAFPGGYNSWERMISRLQIYGPVSMDVPASIFQLTPGTVYVSEDIARPIEPMDLVEF